MAYPANSTQAARIAGASETALARPPGEMSELVITGCAETFRWDAICVTARNSAHAEAYKRELHARRWPAALVLAASDPGEPGTSETVRAPCIGSGGATLNALLLIAEHLSALAGENNLDASVLNGRRVLVLHVGAEQRMPAFSLLPAGPEAGNTAGACRVRSTVDLLLEGLASLASSCPPGLFVVSSEDSFVHVGECFRARFAETARRATGGSGAATAVAMSLPLGEEVARRHGVYEFSSADSSTVSRVHYRAPEEELAEKCALQPRGTNVAKVCGVIFFDEAAATQLLLLTLDPAFEACSYLGIDNGAQPMGFSLYLDLLACLGADVTLEEFGLPSRLVGQVHVDGPVREQLWRLLHGRVHLAAVVAEPDDASQYMSVRTTQDYVRLVATLPGFAPTHEGHENPTCCSLGTLSFSPSKSMPSGASRAGRSGAADADTEESVDPCAWIVNSLVKNCHIAAGAIIESCIMERCGVGAGAVCSGLKRAVGLEVPSGLAVQQLSLLGDKGQGCVVTFRLEDEGRRRDTAGTFLAQPWETFLQETGLEAVDLWDGDVRPYERTLHSARLFPIVGEALEGLGLLWVEYAAARELEQQASRQEGIDAWRRRWVQAWRDAPRISLGEVVARADVAGELAWQDFVAAETNVLHARRLLLYHRDAPLRHILDDEVRRNRWGLLAVFDEIAADESTPPDVAARTLAQIAEVLAAFAGLEGGLRSGSARNPQWRGALAQLASREAGSRTAAVHQMAMLRKEWLGSGPVALMRAARHYEAAAQVLILTAVATCEKFIALGPAKELRPVGSWVVVDAPARIDLAGGWTDTPPVCYEHGGVVTNLALLVDGRRPIGAKAQRLAGRFELVFETLAEGGDGSTDDADLAGSVPAAICRQLSDLDDHNSPSAPAALLKCCVLCCGIVSLAPGSPPLEKQLQDAGGGLHLRSWSNLPQGSGLGTSSILAGVVMKAVLVAYGRDMDDGSLIHAVQNVEQMLTTGGGWQDQAGAILGGAKITRSAAQLPLQVVPEALPLDASFAEALSSRIVLIYTGRPRLAKYLLQNVIRQWFSRMPEICSTVRELTANAEAAAEAIRSCSLERLGACLSTYWSQKKVMAPGCEPQPIAALRERLEPHLLGFSLAGAGGGGFAVLILREPGQEALGRVREALRDCQGMESAYVCDAAIDFEGVRVR